MNYYDEPGAIGLPEIFGFAHLRETILPCKLLY